MISKCLHLNLSTANSRALWTCRNDFIAYCLQPHLSQCFLLLFVSRTVRLAMQVPVLMTTQGQKFSTVTVNSPSVRSSILSLPNSVTGGNSAGKMVLQAVPTLVPAQGQSGERITLQLITLPTMPGKPGTPITLSTFSPVTVPTSNTQVLKLAIPSNITTSTSTAPVTVVTSQPGVTMVPNVQPAMSLQDVTIIKVESPEVSVDQTVNSAAGSTPSTQTNPTTTQSWANIKCHCAQRNRHQHLWHGYKWNEWRKDWPSSVKQMKPALQIRRLFTPYTITTMCSLKSGFDFARPFFFLFLIIIYSNHASLYPTICAVML